MPYIIYCNGKVEFEVIHPNDRIVIDACLPGGGRTKVDHHQGGKCGPCYICNKPAYKDRYVHLAGKTEQKHEEFVKLVKSRYPDIEQNSCICHNCERNIQRGSDFDTDMVSETKRVRGECCVQQYLSADLCSQDIVQSQWNLQEVILSLKDVKDSPSVEVNNVWLCRKHYRVVHDFMHQRRISCTVCKDFCDQKTERGTVYKFDDDTYDCTFFQGMSELASKVFCSKIKVEKESKFCRNCFYKLKDDMVNDKDMFQHPCVHLPILREIIRSHPVAEPDSCPDAEQIQEMSFS